MLTIQQALSNSGCGPVGPGAIIEILGQEGTSGSCWFNYPVFSTHQKAAKSLYFPAPNRTIARKRNPVSSDKFEQPVLYPKQLSVNEESLGASPS
jgi:hypothetical protein